MFHFRSRKKKHHEERDEKGRRIYKQMAVSPEAHRRISQRSDETGDTIIDTVDKIMGVK